MNWPAADALINPRVLGLLEELRALIAEKGYCSLVQDYENLLFDLFNSKSYELNQYFLSFIPQNIC